jgi:drug/metabolite transporter (DMT)-like permease
MWKPAMPQARHLAYLGLLFNALVWGVSWWPFRAMADYGVHPLWSTAIIYAACVACLAIAYRKHLSTLFNNPWLLLLVASSGINNAAFNWAVTIGEVIRVVLLFYLMPMWVALLAWWLLKERPGKREWGQIALALTGAYLVLQPAGMQRWDFPWPSSLADWLGVLGGMTFALTTVLLRKTAQEPAGKATLAMFGGGALVSTVAALALSYTGSIPTPPWPVGPAAWWPLALVFGIALLASNLSFQFGARRVSSATAALVMLNEIMFATLSAVWLGADSLSTTKLLGLAFIVGASLLAIRKTS